MKIELPSTSIFQFYEGTNVQQYTNLTGINLNTPARQLLKNDVLIMTYMNGLMGFADPYSSVVTYNMYDMVKGADGVLYTSKVNENLGHPVTSTQHWDPIKMGVNDEIVSRMWAWSSKRTQDEILSMTIALG